MEKKIDIDDKNEAIGSKIEKFCSVLDKMPTFPNFVIVSEGKELDLVKSCTINDLFSDLEKKNKFTDDEDVYEETKTYCDVLKFMSADQNKLTPPSFDEHQSKFEEMTNREFLKKFIKNIIILNGMYCAMPKWKRICHVFLGCVGWMSGISILIAGILAGSKPVCFLGFLIMCAWAGLICSLVFHLSLALLIPSAIILGFRAIVVFVSAVKSQVDIYKVRQEKGTDIDNFFHIIDEINNYLDTHDFPPKEISSGEQIFNESQIKKKIENANTNKDNGKGNNVIMEENDDDKSEKGKNK